MGKGQRRQAPRRDCLLVGGSQKDREEGGKTREQKLGRKIVFELEKSQIRKGNIYSLKKNTYTQ